MDYTWIREGISTNTTSTCISCIYSVHTLLKDSASLEKRGSFNSLKADSENVAALMCLTEEMDVTQNTKDTLDKLVCLVSFTKEIYIISTCCVSILRKIVKLRQLLVLWKNVLSVFTCRLVRGPNQQYCSIICLIHSNTVSTGIAVVMYYQPLQRFHSPLYN